MILRDDIIAETMRAEGGYSDHPADSGGPTNYGITESTARAAGYTGDMRDLTPTAASDIYIIAYWSRIKGDRLAVLSAATAREVFDTAVHGGPPRAVRYLQRALNALVDGDLRVDGRIGDKTLAALQWYMRAREEYVLVRTLNCLQGAYYIRLTERRHKDRAFIYGWIKNRTGASTDAAG